MENLNIPEEQTTAEMITEYAGLLWHWTWLLILLAVLAGGISYYLSSHQTPVYQASTLIMINGAPGIQSDAYSLYIAQQSMATYAQIMTTRPMLEAIAKQMGLTSVPGTIQVQTVANTTLMKIVVQGQNPDQVALIANAVFSVFASQLRADQSSRYADAKSNLESQIANVQKQIQDTTNSLVAVNKRIEDTQASLSLLNQNIADTTKTSGYAGVSQDDRDQLAQLQSSLLQSQIQQTQLQNALSQYQNSNFSLTQSYGQLKLTEAQSNDLVIQKDPAVAPVAPISPQPLRSAMLAAVVGLFLGAGIVFLIEFLDDSLRDPQEITRKWGIPVLGMILNFNSGNGNGLITEKEPRSPVSEEFRSIRTNLQFTSVASPLHTILITSASPEDGKTTIAGNLACVFAQVGRKVVVVDSDLRRPRLHKLFELPNRFGLTDQFIRPQEYLQGAVQQTEVKNLYLLSSGSLPPNPSELISSQRMVEILQTLEAQYEVVFLDAPPSLVVTDANVLANHADGVILVIRPATTKRAAIKHTIEQLAQVKANIVGVVLNGVDVKKSRYSYYRGYYHNYGRGYAYYSDIGPARNEKRRSRKSINREDARGQVNLKNGDSVLDTEGGPSFGDNISEGDDRVSESFRSYQQEKPTSENTAFPFQESPRENTFSSPIGNLGSIHDNDVENPGVFPQGETKEMLLVPQEKPVTEEQLPATLGSPSEDLHSSWIERLRSRMNDNQENPGEPGAENPPVGKKDRT